MRVTLEQMELRRSGIGGSEIAAVAGLHPYMSALDVWLAKVGFPEQDLSDNYHVARGRHLGPAIVEWYQERTGITVEHYGRDERTMIHPEHRIVIATPDGIAADRVIEVKSPSTGTGWGAPGTDEVPEYIIPQVVWQMAVTGKRKADVVALIYGDLRIYPLRWSHRVFDALLVRAREFWRLVETETPPRDCRAGEGALRRLYAHSNGEMLESTTHVDGIAERLIAAIERRKAAEKAEQKIRAEMIAEIGEHDGVKGEWGSVTFRETRPHNRIDWAGVAKECEISGEIIVRHTTMVNGARRLIVRPMI